MTVLGFQYRGTHSIYYKIYILYFMTRIRARSYRPSQYRCMCNVALRFG